MKCPCCGDQMMWLTDQDGIQPHDQQWCGRCDATKTYDTGKNEVRVSADAWWDEKQLPEGLLWCGNKLEYAHA